MTRMPASVSIEPCACVRHDWLDEDWGSWGDDARPGRAIDPHYVRLMLDYDRFNNVWDSSGAACVPYNLPVSVELRAAIERWSTDHEDLDRLLRGDYLYAENSPDYPLQWMNARGAALADRLRAELGSEWTVDHLPLHRVETGEIGMAR